MSQLLSAMHALDLDDPVEDVSDISIYEEKSRTEETDVTELTGTGGECRDLEKSPHHLAKFLEIVSSLPYELKLKIFQLCFERFYKTELLPYLGDDRLLPILRMYYDEILVGDGKLYFGGFNEFDVIKFVSTEFQQVFKPVVAGGHVRIRILKIYDLAEMDDEDVVLLLAHAERIWCASVTALNKIYQLHPDALNKITDLSVENMAQFSHEGDLRPMFSRLASSLKDFTLPMRPEEFDKVSVIFEALKDVDHQLTVHLPLSFPLDMSSDVQSLQKTLLGDCPNVKLAHILFTMVSPTFRLAELAKFVGDVGCDKFTDFCLVSLTNSEVVGTLDFLSQLSSLVTIVLSGKFTFSEASLGSLTNLTQLKELMLEHCQLDAPWFNTCLPDNLKDVTISHNAFPNNAMYIVPKSLKALTILAGDAYDIELANLDFSQTDMTLLKFRVDDDSQWSRLVVTLRNLPKSLQEVNCYKLTTFIVEKDVKLKRRDDLTVCIMTASGLPAGLNMATLRANVKVIFRRMQDGHPVILGQVERIESIGGLPNRMLE